MKEKQYPVSAISRMRIGTDGQGIRTLIALNGCPLRCKYCINKFTWDGSVEPQFLTAEEIYNRIRCDITYMRATNGGVTFGGGEPLMFPQLIVEFRELCGCEMNINIETSLNVPINNVRMIADVVDKFTIDVKTMDKETYLAYTGHEIDCLLSNIQMLMDEGFGDKIEVRVPMIPEYVDEVSRDNSVHTLKEMGITKFDMFTYRLIE